MVGRWSEPDSNRGLRWIAVLMAITLWIFVGLMPRIDTDTRKLTVEIKVRNGPNTPVLRTQPAVAEVVLEGPKTAIGTLSDRDLDVFVDMRGRWSGQSEAQPLQVLGPPPGVHWKLNPTEVQVIKP